MSTKVTYDVDTYVKHVDAHGDERFKVDDIICNRVLLPGHIFLLLSPFCGKIRIRNIYCRYNHGIAITSIAIINYIRVMYILRYRISHQHLSTRKKHEKLAFPELRNTGI